MTRANDKTKPIVFSPKEHTEMKASVKDLLEQAREMAAQDRAWAAQHEVDAMLHVILDHQRSKHHNPELVIGTPSPKYRLSIGAKNGTLTLHDNGRLVFQAKGTMIEKVVVGQWIERLQQWFEDVEDAKGSKADETLLEYLLDAYGYIVFNGRIEREAGFSEAA